MKNKYALHRWFKWGTIIFGIAVVLILGYGAVVYKSIQNDKTEGFNESKQTILAQTEVIHEDHMTAFYGEEAFHILFGRTDSSEAKIVFLPLNNDDDLTVLDQSDIISKSEIKQDWHRQCTHCSLVKITPAMIKNKPLWEITYKDRQNRYVFDYLSMYDASRYERYAFRKMFN